MRLMSVGSVRIALNEVDYDDVNKMLATALDIVTTSLEVALQTEFSYKPRIDVFRSNIGLRFSQDTPELNLRSGFVSPTSVSVSKYSTYANALKGIDGVDVEYLLRDEHGVVTVLEPEGYAAFRVEYESGLPDDGQSYLAEALPDWLRAACIQYTRVVYAGFVQAKVREAEADIQYSDAVRVELPGDILNLIGPHIRWFPTAIRPSGLL